MSNIVRCTRDEDIAIITINNPPVNASSQAVRQNLQTTLQDLKQDESIKAIVLCCEGSTFMAGADIQEFTLEDIPAPDPNDVHELLESSNVPVVAVLHGTPLGGGLELALSCHYRIAHEKTRLGLPEVALGLVPGSGGTQRLPRLTGVAPALDMIVTGKPIPASKALDIGLVDELCSDGLNARALEFARELAGTDVSGRRLASRSIQFTPDDQAAIDQWLDKLAPADKGGHAPRACVEAVRKAELPFAEGLRIERELFMECKDTTESKSLRHIFFAQRAAARMPGLASDTQLRTVNTVGIVGAGTMGTGIAISFANAGFPVVLHDISPESLARGQAHINKTYEGAVARNRMSPETADKARQLINTSSDDAPLSKCDLIIEAVVERMDIKLQIFKNLGRIAKPGAILASNTSSLDVNRLSEASGRPADVLGLHFFSPANIMRLLEVVRTDTVAPEVMATVIKLAKRIGKVPVISGVCFGFIGNRMLEGYLREVEFLVLEGASPARIDQAVEGFGLAMGPCRMMDMAGVDIGASIVLEQKEAGTLPNDPQYRVVVQRLYELGRNGQKTGKGYYRYEGRNAVEDPDVQTIFAELAQQHGVTQRNDITDEEIVERCLLPLITEGYKILNEGIAYRSGDIDTVWINGYGFPAWRGGPMFYAETRGTDYVRDRVRHYADTLGNEFGYWDMPEIPG